MGSGSCFRSNTIENKNMGTRNLTIVHINGEYKVAQYGQWDGYPGGQGATILDFLGRIGGEETAQFKNKLMLATFHDTKSLNELQHEIEMSGLSSTWQKTWPELSRDTGAEVLDLIFSKPDGIKLKNEMPFAGDSLMCEWAYVIDFDTNKLEVYRGFNREPLDKDDRFYHVKGLDDRSSTGYFPMKMAASYDLVDLPSVAKMEMDCLDRDKDEY